MSFPEIHNLANQLLAFEAARNSAPGDAGAEVALRVIEELRGRLTRLAGVDGFRSLLSRALSLGKAELPAINLLQVAADGTLEGFEAIELSQEPGVADRAGAIVVAYLLELLVTFIGDSLTLSLVRDAWPDASAGGADVGTEEKP